MSPTRHRSLPAAVAATLVAGVCAVMSLATAAPAAALDNGLVTTPPMGFNDWNAFGCNVDEQLIEQTADFFVSSGLKAAGYEYVNIDDCWLEKSRSADGHLVPDPVKFPDGIKGTADYVHSLGLKIGIYEDAGAETCAGYPGSLNHEQTDADDFAAWGIDYLKYDNCNNDSDGSLSDYQSRYTAMGDALKKSGRKIVYSICEWGVNDPADWAGDVGNLWRTTNDINDSWASLKSIIAQNAVQASAAHPGAWNDPDMLEVGNGGMTDTEYKTHFSLWAEMAAPLLIGTDLRKATPETMAIYENKDVIAVDQDKLGVQGQVIAQQNGTMVFSKPLANGDRAIALYNSNDTAATLTTTAKAAGLAKSTEYTTKDLWTRQTTETAGTVSARVPAHGTVLLRVKSVANSAKPPATTLVADSPSGYGDATTVLPAGGSSSFTSTITDDGHDPLVGLRFTATAPAGWTVAPTTKANADSLGSGKSHGVTWAVSAPAGTAAGDYQVPVTVTYNWGDNRRTAVSQLPVTLDVVPTPPTGRSDLSDDPWVSATNSWGPVEKDRSNGDTAAGDGKPITLDGDVYPKGFGTNATSDIVYYLGGQCSQLRTDVGIDDEVGTAGSAIFQVYADDALVADSGVVTGSTPAKLLVAAVTGATWLRLHADPNGPTTSDHTDWAAPTLTCSAPAAGTETFDELTPELGPRADETGVPTSLLGFTHTTPAGWTVTSDPTMAGRGVTEWRGWSFVTPQFWDTAAPGQGRAAFTKGSGVVAVADDDEWDDTNHPGDQLYASTLTSPGYDVTGKTSVHVNFDSSYRQTGPQVAALEVTFDGGAPQRLFEYTTAELGDQTYLENRTLTVPVTVPAGAKSMKVSWVIENAHNDWYWAIDNASVTDQPIAGGEAPLPASAARKG